MHEVKDCFTLACAASRAHDNLASIALRQYGNHGPQISGCVRSHFPKPIKDELRALAQRVSYWSDRAYKSRPPRVRHETIRRIGREIAARDGCGFYGPQDR